METLPLAGQVALVAGATRGAGRGIARALGEAGARVYCTGRSVAGSSTGMGRPDTIEETAALIEESGGRAIAVRVDHTREEEVARLVGRVRDDAGRLDVLVKLALLLARALGLEGLGPGLGPAAATGAEALPAHTSTLEPSAET